MSGPSLNLVVLRVPDLQRAVDFYSGLGLTFTQHAHGKGPVHYAAEMGSAVFELYPLMDDNFSTKQVRLGFQVSQASAVLERLLAKGGTLVSPPKDSPWGLRAVLDDPFGHRLELTEAKN